MRTGLLRPVEHGDGRTVAGKRGESLGGEGAVQSDLEHTDPLPRATSAATASGRAPPPEPMMTITRSASGCPEYSKSW